MTRKPDYSRRALLQAGAAAGLLALAPSAMAAEIGKPEKPKLTLGLAVPAASFLPVYVAKAHTWEAQG